MDGKKTKKTTKVDETKPKKTLAESQKRINADQKRRNDTQNAKPRDAAEQAEFNREGPPQNDIVDLATPETREANPPDADQQVAPAKPAKDLRYNTPGGIVAKQHEAANNK